MRKFLALIALVAGTVQPAYAVDCVVSSFTAEFWRHKEAARTYVLVYGSFDDPKKVGGGKIDPATDYDAKVYEKWSMKFVGYQASRYAFDQPFETEVTLILPDYSNIIGANTTADEIGWLDKQTGLVWLEQTSDGYQAEAALCSSILDWDASHVKPALRCLRGGNCPKE